MALDLDWNGMFVPTKPLLEIIIRGSAIYLGLFALLRIVLKRQASGLSITDMLVIVLLADAAQNGMADDYQSISEGWLLVGTILSWAYALDWLEFHSPWFS